MSNIEIYHNAFVEGLDMNPDDVASAKRGEVEKWDSIGQMSLVAILEDEFGIEFDPKDILLFDSYEKGIEILAKYSIDVRA